MTTALAKLDEKGIVLNTLDDVRAYALEVITTSLCPKQYVGKPKDAMIAILAGRQFGFGPLQSLRAIAVINGRPCLYGEDRSAVVLGSGKVEWVKEWFEIDGKTVVPNYPDLKSFPGNLMACWQSKRKDQSEPTKISRFSVADAKIAGLWGKAGPWTQYPLRMLHWRATAYGERDCYGDALGGIEQVEEMQDFPKAAPSPLEKLAEPENPTTPPPQEYIDVPAYPIQEAKPGITVDELVKRTQTYIDGKHVEGALPAKDLLAEVRDFLLGPNVKNATPQQLADLLAEATSGKWDLPTAKRIPETIGGTTPSENP